MLLFVVNRKGSGQKGRAGVQLAGLSAETFLQKPEQPRHFDFSFG